MRYSTLDFVIEDETHLMAFLHVMAFNVYSAESNNSSLINDLMLIYNKIKIKCKIGFECWKRHIKLVQLFKDAIKKTVKERESLAVHMVHRQLF